MALSEDLHRRAEESRRRLASMTPDASLWAAALLREVKPCLKSDREREIAEEMAQRFEQRATAQVPGSPSASA